MNNLQKSFSPMAKSQLMSNYFLVGQGAAHAKQPAKFGIKFWMLCDVKTFYFLRAMPYVGKEDRPQVGVAEQVVMSLMEPYRKTGQNVATVTVICNCNIHQRS